MTNAVDMRDAFFDRLYEYVARDGNVIVLTADHGAFGLKKIEEDYPAQYLNTGICEQNMVSVAGGLAASGKKVYIYAINNFVSLRTLEHVNVDVCSMNLDVNIIGVGAGFTYATDGPTHQGLQDMAAMSNLPNISVYNATDATQTKGLVDISFHQQGPKYFRIEKGVLPRVYTSTDDLAVGYKTVLENPSNFVVLSTGYMTNVCYKVLNAFDENVRPSLVDIFRIRPLNVEKIVDLCKEKNVVTVEENLHSGGLGEKILAALKLGNHKFACTTIAVEDGFYFQFGTRDQLHEKVKLGPSNIFSKIENFIQENLHEEKN
jgi:transketolase